MANVKKKKKQLLAGISLTRIQERVWDQRLSFLLEILSLNL